MYRYTTCSSVLFCYFAGDGAIRVVPCCFGDFGCGKIEIWWLEGDWKRKGKGVNRTHVR